MKVSDLVPELMLNTDLGWQEFRPVWDEHGRQVKVFRAHKNTSYLAQKGNYLCLTRLGRLWSGKVERRTNLTVFELACILATCTPTPPQQKAPAEGATSSAGA